MRDDGYKMMQCLATVSEKECYSIINPQIDNIITHIPVQCLLYNYLYFKLILVYN